MDRTTLIFLTQGAFLGGVGVASFVRLATLRVETWPALTAWWLCLGLSLIVVRFIWPAPSMHLVVIILLAGLGGGWYVTNWRLHHQPQTIPYNQTLTLIGSVANYPTIQERTQEFIFSTAIEGQNVRFLVQTNREPRLFRGSTVRLTGKLVQPPNERGFDYRSNLETRAIYGLIVRPESIEVLRPPQGFWAWLDRWRGKLLTTLDQTLPEPAASLAAGLAIGVRPAIDQEFSQALRVVNLTHLAAVSGQNLTITIFLVFLWLRRRWLRGAIIISLALLTLYVILVGVEPSILRAALMASLILVSPLVGRPLNLLRSLLVAATILTLAAPLSLTRDVGFAMSFLALAGIVLLGPHLELLFLAFPKSLRLTLATILAATIAVLPVQLVTFGTLSPIGPLANLIVTPLVSLAMLGALLVGLLGLASLQLAQIIAWLVYFPLEWIHRVAVVLARVPFAQITFQPSSHLAELILLTELAGFGLLTWQRLRQQPGLIDVSLERVE